MAVDYAIECSHQNNPEESETYIILHNTPVGATVVFEFKPPLYDCIEGILKELFTAHGIMIDSSYNTNISNIKILY